MPNNFKDWCALVRDRLRGPHVRALEDALGREQDQVVRERAEIVRLREENRALLNSLLGVAGVPPVETPRAAPQSIAPIRRRTWPQIASTREIEAARQAQKHEAG